MKSVSATKFHRKYGGAEGRDLQFLTGLNRFTGTMNEL
jgi:hypothetical protein